MHDVAIVGAGVLGSVLACEAKALGLSVVVVAPTGSSPSFEAGAFFRLNTWIGHGQHPRLEAGIRRRDRSRFPVATTLPAAAAELLKQARVPRISSKVSSLRCTPEGVELRAGTKQVVAKAALLAPGWGRPTAMPRGAWDFSSGLLAFAQGRMKGRVVGLVGAGPSALSFLEACLGLSPRRGLALKRQFLLWFQGTKWPAQSPQVQEMFGVRYGPVLRAALSSEVVTAVPRRIEKAARRGGRWRLVDGEGEVHLVDELVWCGGYEAPLELISRGAKTVRPFTREGVKLAMQRVGARGPEPVFQVGPALDQLGYASWDMGPYAEWFEKGRRVLTELAR